VLVYINRDINNNEKLGNIQNSIFQSESAGRIGLIHTNTHLGYNNATTAVVVPDTADLHP